MQRPSINVTITREFPPCLQKRLYTGIATTVKTGNHPRCITGLYAGGVRLGHVPQTRRHSMIYSQWNNIIDLS